VSIGRRGIRPSHGANCGISVTKNPNVLLVKDAIEQTRLGAGIQMPSLPGALKHAHRRRVQALSAQMRLRSNSLLRYQRMLLKDMKPLDAAR
jgi:hypothetical protein